MEENKENNSSKIIAAFVKAQGEVTGVVKDKANGGFKGSKYADLSAIIDMLKPVLKENGLALLQVPTLVTNSAGITSVTIESTLMHTSGQCLILPPVSIPVGANCTAHMFGSATAYGRRYSAAAIFMVPWEDDDGNKASGLEVPKQPTPSNTFAAADRSREPTRPADDLASRTRTTR